MALISDLIMTQKIIIIISFGAIIYIVTPAKIGLGKLPFIEQIQGTVAVSTATVIPVCSMNGISVCLIYDGITIYKHILVQKNKNY